MQAKQFLIDTIGIFVLFFIYGIVQEKLIKGKYVLQKGSNNQEEKLEKFTYSLTLVLFVCVMNYIVARIKLKIWPRDEDKTKIFYYASVSLTYLLAMICSFMALQYVSYPAQVVGKSAKPIPVLILGVLLGNKSYHFRKYVFVFLVVVGVILFMYKEPTNYKNQDKCIFGIGELLLILSLAMDGITGAIQERIRAEARPTGHQMMLSINAFATVYLIFITFLSGEMIEFISFSGRHPYIFKDLFLLGITASIGQLFVFSMISNFGPLPLSIVTTTRKFFNVLASILVFGNSLTGKQWCGTVIVFTSLFLDALYSKSPKKEMISNK